MTDEKTATLLTSIDDRLERIEDKLTRAEMTFAGFPCRAREKAAEAVRERGRVMRATTVMLLAIGILVLTHWANNEPTVNPKMVVELAFALLVIAFLDQGKTEPVATGFAWLFFAAVLLSSKSLLTALGKAGGTTTTSTTKAA